MKSLTSLLILQSVVTCAGFTLPENLPNGVYSAHMNNKGLEIHDGLTLEHTTTMKPKVSSSELETRQTKEEGGWDRSEPELYCGCGLSMNHGNCDTAVDMLKAQFDRSDGGVGQVHQAWYSIWGDVVAFCCTDTAFPMRSSQYAGLLQRITDRCGWYVPGTLVPSSIGFDTVGCGYMNYSPGLDFCANSVSGRFMGRDGRC